MTRLLALVAAGSLLIPTFAFAGVGHGRHDRGWGPPGHYARYYDYPSYYHYGHHSHGDSDDAAWAIGGLVLGAIIGSTAARHDAEASQASAPLPPPQKRKVVTCYDEVAYDEKGDPYVARQCYENWR
jgi:hypothetical protein